MILVFKVIVFQKYNCHLLKILAYSRTIGIDSKTDNVFT